jgi:hypothetical protein
LELHLNLEAKEAAIENGVTSEITVAVCSYQVPFLIFFIRLILFSPGFQILYPIALAAAIFSMQPGAIPFDLTPRSFAFAVFILIVIVYAIRLIGRHTQPRWPLQQNPLALWLKRKKVDEDVDKFSVNGFGDTFSSPTGISLDAVVDEERNSLATNDNRACGTRAICGPSGTKLELQPS